MKQSLIPRQTIMTNLSATLCVERNEAEQTVTVLRIPRSLFSKPQETRLEIQLSLMKHESAFEAKEVEMQPTTFANTQFQMGNAELPQFVQATEIYILQHIKPDSNLCDVDFRFEKLKLAAAILLFVKNNSGNMEDLYNQALSLEKQYIGNHLYPRGKLGDLIIKIRAEVDEQFAAQLKQDREVENNNYTLPATII